MAIGVPSWPIVIEDEVVVPIAMTAPWTSKFPVTLVDDEATI